MREEDDVAVGLAYARDDPVCPDADLLWRFSSGTPVPEDLPIRSAFADLPGRQALIRPVAPFREVGPDGGGAAEPGQLACLARPPQGADECEGVAPAGEYRPQPFGEAPAGLRQRQVGRARVLAGQDSIPSRRVGSRTRPRPSRLPRSIRPAPRDREGEPPSCRPRAPREWAQPRRGHSRRSPPALPRRARPTPPRGAGPRTGSQLGGC